MALNEILCTTGGSTCHVLPQRIESLRLGITPFGKTQASQSCKIATVQSVVCWWLLRSSGTRLSRSWRSFANTKASTRQRPCRRQPVGICSARSHAEDLYQVFRMSPGHQRMWRSSEAWLRSQPRVTARVSPHEAWDFLRTVLAADPEDAEMEGFFGCCFRRGNAWGCLPFFWRHSHSQFPFFISFYNISVFNACLLLLHGNLFLRAGSQLVFFPVRIDLLPKRRCSTPGWCDISPMRYQLLRLWLSWG